MIDELKKPVKGEDEQFEEEEKEEVQEEETPNDLDNFDAFKEEKEENFEESYEEPSFEEVHEDVPDVIDEKDQLPQENLEQNEVEPQEKMLTQSQVNELVGRARQEGRMSAVKELLERYGVGDENELNDVFGRGQAYDGLNDDYTNVNHLYNEVMAENALLKSRVDMNRWEDIKLILGGKGLDITVENIEAMLPSHPEWRMNGNDSLGDVGVQADANQVNGEANGNVKPSVLHKLGEDVSPQSEELTEEEQVRKWYGI